MKPQWLDPQNKLLDELVDLKQTLIEVTQTPAVTDQDIAFQEGRLWSSGARLDLSSDDRGIWQFRNPAESGVIAVIIAISLYTDEPTHIRFREHFTALGDAQLDFQHNKSVASVTPACEIRSLNNGSSDPPGSLIPIEAQATVHAPYIADDLVIVVPPGVGVLMWTQAPGGLTGSADMAGSGTWFEKDIE